MVSTCCKNIDGMTTMQFTESMLMYLICLFVKYSAATAQNKISIVRQQSIVNGEISFSDELVESTLGCSMVCFHNKKCRIGYFNPVTKRCALYSSDTLVSNTNEAGMLLVVDSRKNVAVCPDTKQNNSGCYYFSTYKLSWDDAKDSCQEFGGYLVEITSSTENTFIQSEAMKRYDPDTYDGITGTGYWIGMKEINNEWVWVNSSALITFFDWRPREPNNVLEECGNIKYSSGFKWNDYYCYKLEYFICEIN